MAQLKYYNKVAPNDLFVCILIVYFLIQSLTCKKKEFSHATDTDNDVRDAWRRLIPIFENLYSADTLTLPENVHIKGDLLVGTYKDQNNNEKGWDDSIEHTCVWFPKKQGGNNTTGPGWISAPSVNYTWRRNSKPFKGGGVFSFRAGHADLHPICISRKQSRLSTAAAGTSEANSRLESTNRRWNPTKTDNIHFRSLTDQVFNKDNKHRIVDIQEIQLYPTGSPPGHRSNKIHVSGLVETDKLYDDGIDNMEAAFLRDQTAREVTCKSNFVVSIGKMLQMDEGTHLDLLGSMRMTEIKASTSRVVKNLSDGLGTDGWVFEDTGDKLRLTDGG